MMRRAHVEIRHDGLLCCTTCLWLERVRRPAGDDWQCALFDKLLTESGGGLLRCAGCRDFCATLDRSRQKQETRHD
jgi:hypothetical protein